jgi:CRP-like cAMP-binding protein
VSFTTEDCELAYIKQDQFRVSLQNETKILDSKKQTFAAQNLLLRSIRDVVETEAYERLIKGMQLEAWSKDEAVISKGERGDKLYFVAEGKVTCFEREDSPTSALGVNA